MKEIRCYRMLGLSFGVVLFVCGSLSLVQLQPALAAKAVNFSDVKAADSKTASVSQGTVSGVATDKITKTPLSGVKIIFESGINHYEMTTDRKGKYKIPNVVSGSYTIEVTKPGYQRLANKGLMVQPDKTLKVNARLVSESAQATPPATDKPVAAGKS